ncbi:MAG TPA: Crp/Fnr family transcriptional regulator [Candidatus Aminicenantes bacterium]|nr:Crp/Fnr family transcriptional regulator [Candidatus Aminicenantes bacterium]
MIDLATLRKFDIFKGLTDAELENIQSIAKLEKFKANTRVFEEDSLAMKMYLVLKGRVEIRLKKAAGFMPITIDVVGPGEIFGWSAVTNPFTFTAGAWTVADSELVAINGEVLRKIFKINNHLGYKVMMQIAAVISKRFRSLSKKMVELLPAQAVGGERK